MVQGSGKSLKSYLLSSFFGAAMVATAYAYFNYKFSQFNHINFDKESFYTIDDLFNPKEDEYTVIVFSSKKDKLDGLLKRVSMEYKILAIDINGKRFKNSDKVDYVTAGINTILPITNRFRIYEVPVVFDIKRVEKNKYKQSSKIEYF